MEIDDLRERIKDVSMKVDMAEERINKRIDSLEAGQLAIIADLSMHIDNMHKGE